MNTSSRWGIIGVLALAFATRVVGIFYGLPLWVIGDEPPFILAALKLIDLKSLAPWQHIDELSSVLYFPPYLAYIYVLLFLPILGIKYLSFSGTADVFRTNLALDLSDFFVAARISNVVIATLTIYLTYLIGRAIYKKHVAALGSAYLLAFSVLHLSLSFTARDWIPATFLFVLSIWVLTAATWSAERKYIGVSIIAGIAAGFSLIAGFIMVFLLIWYLFVERHSVREALWDRTMYKTLAIFLFLAAMSISIYPYGFHFASDNSIAVGQSLRGFLFSLPAFYLPLLLADPTLCVFMIIGLFLLLRRERPIAIGVCAFLFTYAAIFYFLYHYEQRFLIYMYPLFSIIGGYAVGAAWEQGTSRTMRSALILILLVPVLISLRFDMLLLRNDPRVQAIHWINQHIPPNSKVIVYAPHMRVRSNSESISELRAIDPSALRQVDFSEEKVNTQNSALHALNLYTISTIGFFEHIDEYAQANKYQYLVLGGSMLDSVDGFSDAQELPINQYVRLTSGRQQPKYLTSSELIAFRRLIGSSTPIASFGSSEEYYSTLDSKYGFPLGLFRREAFGPRVAIYLLK